MHTSESPVPGLQGHYRDTLRGPDGRIVWTREWSRNAIVGNFRRLLAAFCHGAPSTALGIQGLYVGAGLPAWDHTPATPPTGAETALTDPHPFLVGSASMAFSYLEGDTVSATPTHRLQIVVSIGPDTPPWPDPNHPTGNLREFGLVGDLDGSPVLLNYVRHPVIAKDPASTLERTIWLIF